MHDIGKVGIDDSILHKPGKLDPDEFEIMKTHAELGHHILTRIDQPLLSMAARIAHEHHENYDGSGYPKGLKGEEISIEGASSRSPMSSTPSAMRGSTNRPGTTPRSADYFKNNVAANSILHWSI
jgi:hypothetical protein